MMQDYPKTLPPSAKVGFTVSSISWMNFYFILVFLDLDIEIHNFFPRMQVMDTWLAYAPVKNNPEDAAKVCYALEILNFYVIIFA